MCALFSGRNGTHGRQGTSLLSYHAASQPIQELQEPFGSIKCGI